MENENTNPLGLKLDEHGTMTDIDELKDMVHSFAKQTAMMLGENMALGMFFGPMYEVLVNMAIELHNLTCPTRAGKKAWSDLEQRALAVIEENKTPRIDKETTQGTPTQIALPESVESVLREVLGQ